MIIYPWRERDDNYFFIIYREINDKTSTFFNPDSCGFTSMKKNNRLGGQYKVQRISNSREHIDGILKSIKYEDK